MVLIFHLQYDGKTVVIFNGQFSANIADHFFKGMKSSTKDDLTFANPIVCKNKSTPAVFLLSRNRHRFCPAVLYGVNHCFARNLHKNSSDAHVRKFG